MNDSQWLSFIFYRITYIKFLLSKNTYYKTYTHKYYKPRYFNEENILNFQVIDIDTHTDNNKHHCREQSPRLRKSHYVQQLSVYNSWYKRRKQN